MKITSTKCIDGKRHNWKITVIKQYGKIFEYFEWCKKCGSRTEFWKSDNTKGKKLRCIDEDTKDYYIVIPECYKNNKKKEVE